LRPSHRVSAHLWCATCVKSFYKNAALLGAEIKMSRSRFRPASRVRRWKLRRNARSCTPGRHAGSAASQVVVKKCGTVAPTKHTSSCIIWQTIQPVRANSANSPGHSVILCICARLTSHLRVIALPICYDFLGRSAVGSVLKYVRTQNNPFFQNGSRTGRATGARDAMRRLRAARNATLTIMRRYLSLGRVVKCADAAPRDARRLEIAFFSSARERLFRFWSCCGGQVGQARDEADYAKNPPTVRNYSSRALR